MKPLDLLREDHDKHFIIGLAIVLAAALVSLLLVPKVLFVLLGAYGGWHVARAVAWLKEAYDLQRPRIHTSDPMDAEMTVAGASLGLALVICAVVGMAAAGVAL